MAINMIFICNLKQRRIQFKKFEQKYLNSIVPQILQKSLN